MRASSRSSEKLALVFRHLLHGRVVRRFLATVVVFSLRPKHVAVEVALNALRTESTQSRDEKEVGPQPRQEYRAEEESAKSRKELQRAEKQQQRCRP